MKDVEGRRKRRRGEEGEGEGEEQTWPARCKQGRSALYYQKEGRTRREGRAGQGWAGSIDRPVKLK